MPASDTVLPQPARITAVGSEPIVAAAVHDGHQIRDELVPWMNLHAAARLREEDPFTGEWTEIAQTRIVGLRSRFEIDLNRPREKAVYETPADAWGLEVWRSAPPREVWDRSLLTYDGFYHQVHELLSEMQRRFGRFVVFDLHSYNHRRDGQVAAAADPEGNPDVNIGTGTMNRELWTPVVERLIAELRQHDVLGRRLDVRENVKFQGGQFPRWVHEQFPQTGCALAVEVKKFFMDEWTGEPFHDTIAAVRSALVEAAKGVLEELQKT